MPDYADYGHPFHKCRGLYHCEDLDQNPEPWRDNKIVQYRSGEHYWEGSYPVYTYCPWCGQKIEELYEEFKLRQRLETEAARQTVMGTLHELMDMNEPMKWTALAIVCEYMEGCYR